MIGEHHLDKNSAIASALLWPRWLVWLCAAFFFLFPLQTRYIFRQPFDHGVPYEYGTLSLFLVELLGWVVIVLGCWVRYREAQPPRPRSGRLSLLVITLPAWALLSITWAPDKAIALQAAVRLLEGVLLYFVISHTPYAIRQRIMWALIVGATLQTLLGMYQFLTQSAFESTLLGIALHDPRMPGTAAVEFGNERWLRAYGGLPHPNVLGGYLAIATAVAIAMWQRLQRNQRWQRVLLEVAILILLTGIFFSFSRSAWLAAGLIILGCIVKALRQSNTFARTSKSVRLEFSLISRATVMYLLLFVLYLGLLVTVFRPLVVARLSLESSERLETKSRVERAEGVREAWELIKKNPVVGVGIGNYTQGLKRELRPNQPLYTYQPVHSIPMLVWAELGTVGLLLLVGALYKIARQSKFFIFHFSFLILLLLDHYLWTLPFGILLFWSILGLSTRMGLDKKSAL